MVERDPLKSQPASEKGFGLLVFGLWICSRGQRLWHERLRLSTPPTPHGRHSRVQAPSAGHGGTRPSGDWMKRNRAVSVDECQDGKPDIAQRNVPDPRSDLVLIPGNTDRWV